MKPADVPPFEDGENKARRKKVTCPKPSAHQIRSRPGNIMPVHGDGWLVPKGQGATGHPQVSREVASPTRARGGVQVQPKAPMTMHYSDKASPRSS